MARKLTRRQQRAIAASNRASLAKAERVYVRELRALFRKVHRYYEKEIIAHFKSMGGEVRRGRAARQAARQDGFFSSLLLFLYEVIAGQLRVRASVPVDKMTRSVKEVPPALPFGLGITPKDAGVEVALRTIRNENLALIERAHRSYAEAVRKVIDSDEVFGLSVSDLKKELLKRAVVSEARAELIARDQTLKTNAKLNEHRQREAGIEQYYWSTSLDERVRPTHAALEGQLRDWNDPPDFGHPGEDYQCRCVAVAYVPEFES